MIIDKRRPLTDELELTCRELLKTRKLLRDAEEKKSPKRVEKLTVRLEVLTDMVGETLDRLDVVDQAQAGKVQR